MCDNIPQGRGWLPFFKLNNIFLNFIIITFKVLYLFYEKNIFLLEPQVCDNIPPGCGWLPSGSCRECRSVPPPAIYFEDDDDDNDDEHGGRF